MCLYLQLNIIFCSCACVCDLKDISEIDTNSKELHICTLAFFVVFEAGSLSRAAYIHQEPQQKIGEYSEQKRLVAIVFKNWPFYKEKLAITL